MKLLLFNSKLHGDFFGTVFAQKPVHWKPVFQKNRFFRKTGFRKPVFFQTALQILYSLFYEELWRSHRKRLKTHWDTSFGVLFPLSYFFSSLSYPCLDIDAFNHKVRLLGTFLITIKYSLFACFWSFFFATNS